MIARLRSESGQAFAVSAVFITVMLGAVALTVDVGAWFREHRQAQTTADAAALAAAESLPYDTVAAKSAAQSYAGKNGGGVTAGDISFQSEIGVDDTVTVNVKRTVPGFFSRIFSIDSVNVHASAAARAAVPIDAKWVAPIAVNKLHPLLSGPGCPCFNQTTTLPLGKTGAPGAFALVNLDTSVNGNIGASTLGDWILHGFNAYLPLGDYFSDPGAKWNDGPIQSALQARYNTDLLFPVYDTLTGQGQNAEYHVIGWVAFHLLSDVNGGGSSGSITGYFTRMIWDGIQSESGTGGPDFGVHSIALVN
jgi:putative Flp pilus-assembly TadE/G-like protein